MPYIKEEGRLPLNILIETLAETINSKGDLNYVICELVGKLILNTKISYTQISEWIDGVDGAENELRRRLLDPYEDLKIDQNGDVPSFIQILEEME
jgi:hypothetical protein